VGTLGTVWGLTGDWLCGNYQSEDRDGRLFSPSRPCCQQVSCLAFGMSIGCWLAGVCCWHVNSLLLLRKERERDGVHKASEVACFTCEMLFSVTLSETASERSGSVQWHCAVGHCALLDAVSCTV
jgi:hypothetical protein